MSEIAQEKEFLEVSSKIFYNVKRICDEKNIDIKNLNSLNPSYIYPLHNYSLKDLIEISNKLNTTVWNLLGS